MARIDMSKYAGLFRDHTELRVQENREIAIAVTDGKVDQNIQSAKGGVSARVYRNGVYGFASNPNSDDASIQEVLQSATQNAELFDTMAQKPWPGYRPKNRPPLRPNPFQSNTNYQTKKRMISRKEALDFLLCLDQYIAQKYPLLKSRTIFNRSQEIEKQLLTSFGSDSYILYPRSHIYVSMTFDKEGEPIDNYEIFGGFGNFEDHFEKPESLFSEIDELYEHLARKAEGVYPKPGFQDVIVSPDLGGILAHEAVGHTTEADLVKGGSIARDLLNQKVASEMVTLIDFAHHYNDTLLPMPVFVDDEGTQAKDAVLIENGILKGYMHNLQSAQEFSTDTMAISSADTMVRASTDTVVKREVQPTGNARAFLFSDEPLIRMRNTAILPGKYTVEEMIASIEDGYYLMKTMNGQADSTSEFMFGITQGYEIRKGKLASALRDFTVSGVAFDMLKTITMLSREMKWSNPGYCGKKQPMIVSQGSPAIKCKMMIGGRE